MSLSVCIPDLIEQGKLTGARATRAKGIYEQLLNRYDQQMGDAAAKARATSETVAQLASELALKKRRINLQADRQAEIEAAAREQFAGADGGGPISGKALLAHLVRDNRATGISNVEYRWKAIKSQALGRLYDILERHRANLLGEVRHKTELDDVVRAASGEAVDSVNAREFADAWSQTAEWMRQRANAAGADIGKLDGWAVPHNHDAQRVGAVSADRWIADIMPELDRAKILDRDLGLPMADDKLTGMLRDVYETIVSEGWNKRTAGGMGEGAIAGRGSEHRVLHFRNADAWLGYQEKYGSGTIYDAMMGHVEVMSRDIASMEILGPNPTATVRWMQDMVEKEAASKGGMKDRGVATIDKYSIEKVWDEITGENRRVVRRNLALIGSTIRNWQTSTKLGSATLASMSDHATAALTRRFNGLPMSGHLTGYLKGLNPADRSDAAFIRRMGIISDEFTGRMAGKGRMHIEDELGGRLADQGGRGLEVANEASRRIADGVLRVSGLSAHTIAVREATGMQFLAAPRTYADHGWDAVPPPWRRFLQRNGIDASDWDVMRAAKPVEHKGADFLDLDALPQGLRDRFYQGMLEEIDFAVPTGGIYTRAVVNVARPGTIAGELIRTGFQFKMFPVTVVSMHGRRAFDLASPSQRVGYAAAFLGGTFFTGAMSLQLSELAKGRDLLPVGSSDFAWKSMLKGGGLGIFGDLVNLGQNQYGQDFGDIIKGPAWGSAQTANSIRSAAWESLTVDESDPDAIDKAAKLRGKAMREFMTREVPGGNLWYIRAAYERAVVDQLTSWISDGAYDDNFETQIDRATDQGTAYWAPPGGGIAEVRAPDFANALADPPQ